LGGYFFGILIIIGGLVAGVEGNKIITGDAATDFGNSLDLLHGVLDGEIVKVPLWYFEDGNE
jgi:hypothetical protein